MKLLVYMPLVSQSGYFFIDNNGLQVNIWSGEGNTKDQPLFGLTSYILLHHLNFDKPSDQHDLAMAIYGGQQDRPIFVLVVNFKAYYVQCIQLAPLQTTGVIVVLVHLHVWFYLTILHKVSSVSFIHPNISILFGAAVLYVHKDVLQLAQGFSFGSLSFYTHTFTDVYVYICMMVKDSSLLKKDQLSSHAHVDFRSRFYILLTLTYRLGAGMESFLFSALTTGLHTLSAQSKRKIDNFCLRKHVARLAASQHVMDHY